MPSTTTLDVSDFRISPTKLSDAQLQAQIEALLSTDRMVQARTSLADFTKYVFALDATPHQSVWIEALEAVERGDIRFLCVIAPPGHAKSTYHSIVFPAWYLGRHYNESLIGVTTVDTLGKLYGDTVRSVIEDGGKYKSVFPDVAPWTSRGWSTDGFFLKGPKKRGREQKDPSMIYTGAGGPIIGRRADGVIIDDAVDEKTARSEVLLEARKLWVKRTVFSRLKPDGWRIVAGTLWTEDDVVDTAMRSGDYVVVHMAAMSTYTSVAADLWIPNGVKWRPSKYVEG